MTSARLARQVQAEVAAQLKELPARSPARVSIEKAGAILLAASTEAAIEFVNRFAPEHLSLPENEPAVRKNYGVRNDFAGPLAAQSLGDYASGSNHVLPTGGWARTPGRIPSSSRSGEMYQRADHRTKRICAAGDRRGSTERKVLLHMKTQLWRDDETKVTYTSGSSGKGIYQLSQRSWRLKKIRLDFNENMAGCSAGG